MKNEIITKLVEKLNLIMLQMNNLLDEYNIYLNNIANTSKLKEIDDEIKFKIQQDVIKQSIVRIKIIEGRLNFLIGFISESYKLLNTLEGSLNTSDEKEAIKEYLTKLLMTIAVNENNNEKNISK